MTTTSYALDQELNWPYVGLPHFKERALQVQRQSGASYLALVPLVAENERSDWETWSVENAKPDIIPSRISNYDPTTDSVGGSAHGLVGPYYAPVWEVMPQLPHRNMDLFTYEQHGTPLLTGIFSLIEGIGGTVMSKLAIPDETDPDDENSWPFVLMASPVFDAFHSHQSIVGLYASLIPWHKVIGKFGSRR